jgi:hypothetical protein
MRRLLLLVAFGLSAALHAQADTALERAHEELVAARVALESSQAARAAGVEPREGERLGTASGLSRLSDAYWERQKRLEEDVERARQRLEQATERWNALR